MKVVWTNGGGRADEKKRTDLRLTEKSYLRQQDRLIGDGG